MFIGHYAVAFALKPVEKRLSLGWLFVAVMFVDALWSLFNLLGIEYTPILAHPTIAVPYDFVFYPYSHSLLAAFVWAGVTFFLLQRVPLARSANRTRVAAIMAVAVFSHWVCDFIVHEPELSLWGGDPKVGLGLWDYPDVAYLVEAALFIVGVAIYLRSTRGRSSGGKWGMTIFAGTLLILFSLTTFSHSVPPSMTVAAVMNLIITALLALFAGWLDKRRTSKIENGEHAASAPLAIEH